MASLAEAFPGLRTYSAAELSAMSPEQLTALLQTVERAREHFQVKVVQLQTQSEGLNQQVAQYTEKLQAEFGVTTFAEIEALRNQELKGLAAVFAGLEGLEAEV